MAFWRSVRFRFLMMKTCSPVWLLLILVGWSGTLLANDGPGDALTTPRTDVLYSVTGVGRLGSLTEFESRAASERSIAKAFVFSAVVPGAGQVYNKSWWKAGIAVAAEAALLTAYVAWKNKGNDGVREYKDYAHANWSPIKYAEWLNAYGGYSGPDVSIPSLSESDFMHPESWTAEQRAQIDAFFSDIRAAERQSIYLATGASFSHVLPYFGEQQYYELIGKYFQFAPAWSDYDFTPDVDPEGVMPVDAQFYYYAGIHADANDYLRKSSWAGAFVILNHFAAAIDAAVSAKLHNMSLRTRTAIVPGPTGAPMATVGVAFDF